MDPYVFIGELKAITANFDSLKITTGEVLQYFLWNSFDTKFQNHLTTITNKSQPSLSEIDANIFEACKRYIKDNEEDCYVRPKSSFTSTGMAV